MSWYLAVLKKYATFSGRARRKEYWMFQLFNICIILLLYILALVVGANGGAAFTVVYIIYVIYALAIIIPSLAVTVRRLHDIDKSGGWFFISFIPFIGGIWLLVLTCTEGTHGSNSYGPDPKEA